MGTTNLSDLAVDSLSVNSVAMSAIVQGAAAGYKLARGTQAATASKAISTGLTTVVAAIAAPYAATATAINKAVAVSVKLAATAGQISVYRWKHTGASTTTLVAATQAGTVHWVAVGT